MSEGFGPVAPEDELRDTPPEAPERSSEPRTRSTRRPAAGKAERPRTAPRTTKKKPTPPPAPETTPAQAIQGILQIPATGFIMVGQRVESISLVADGATLLVHGPAFAQAVEEIAKNDPRVMAMLEKLVSFGPYGMLVTVTIIMGAQFARNHNEENAVILEGFGAVSPEKIIATASLEVPTPQVSPNGQASPDGIADTTS